MMRAVCLTLNQSLWSTVEGDVVTLEDRGDQSRVLYGETVALWRGTREHCEGKLIEAGFSRLTP